MWAGRRATAPIVVASALAAIVAGVPAPAPRPHHLAACRRDAPCAARDHHLRPSGHLAWEIGPQPPGTVLTLSARPYGRKRSIVLERIDAATTHAFAFTAEPDRTTVYRAALSSGGVATASVGVIGRAKATAQALTLGRARVTLVIFHPRDLRWNGARVRWWFASGPGGRFHPAPATHTRRVSPYVTVARTTLALPAGRYRFRACFHAPNVHALLNPSRPRGCAGRGYHGGAALPVGFPGPRAIFRTSRYLAGRAGDTGFAVVDSEGRMSGLDANRRFVTASVVKAMLLVAYLRRLAALGQRQVDPLSASFLYPMIHVSDNGAATRTYGYVGDAGLYALARAADMADFSVAGFWANAMLTPADQARYFFAIDSLIPPQFVSYARFLLSTIASYESWGIPAVARPDGYRVFFKGGWRPTPRGRLVHQIAQLEGHGRRFSLAIMTDGDPGMQYGIDTISGVTASLLR